jgi:uncharacterized damage-inducible protein DinB
MLHKALIHSLAQLLIVFRELENYSAEEADELYQKTAAGRHVRHVNDHFIALQNGLKQGRVDYNQRHRNSLVETDRQAGRQQVESILHWCKNFSSGDCHLIVISEIDCLQTCNAQFESTLNRELLYLINHTIHHAAHIKLLLSHAGVNLPDHIGLAPGTASFVRESGIAADATSCAQ